jgi:hypothetical protein
MMIQRVQSSEDNINIIKTNTEAAGFSRRTEVQVSYH